MIICLRRDADLHMAQLMPLPLTIFCCSKSRLVLLLGFTFLLPAHPRSPRQSPGAVICCSSSWLNLVESSLAQNTVKRMSSQSHTMDLIILFVYVNHFLLLLLFFFLLSMIKMLCILDINMLTTTNGTVAYSPQC